MKKIELFIISVFLLILNVYGNEKENVELVKCVDGDTAIFNIQGVKTKVRFLGIDTPESVKENHIVEPFSKEASNYSCDKLTKAKEIVLEYDDNSDKQDKYGRTLAWVFVDKKLIEEELVKNGYAKVKYNYKKYTYTDSLYKLQDYAKENKLGIWSDYQPLYYKVTFIDEENITKIDIEEGKKIEYFTPQKIGYKFIGWYLNDNIFDFNTIINEDIILTARYEKDINILEIMLIIILLLTLYIFFNKKGK